MEKLIKLKKIPENAELVIFDLWDTLIASRGKFERQLRESAYDLLKKLKQSKKIIVISTDDGEENAINYLERFKIKQYFDKVYGATYSNNGETHIIAGVVMRKNLSLILRESDTEKEKAVFIGDDAYFSDSYYIDTDSCRKYRIPFIEVPPVSLFPNYDMANLL